LLSIQEFWGDVKRTQYIYCITKWCNRKTPTYIHC
jgi:hypothetical protein